MHRPSPRRAACLLSAIALGAVSPLGAQRAAPPRFSGVQPPTLEAPRERYATPALTDSSATRSHTGEGALIGGVIGVTLASSFLLLYCDGVDNACDVAELGRAMVIIALPPTLVGALIGSAVHTRR
jgi:hypothetical protein